MNSAVKLLAEALSFFKITIMLNILNNIVGFSIFSKKNQNVLAKIYLLL